MVRSARAPAPPITSTSRTARCGPACRVVWQGRSHSRQSMCERVGIDTPNDVSDLRRVCRVATKKSTAYVVIWWIAQKSRIILKDYALTYLCRQRDTKNNQN